MLGARRITWIEEPPEDLEKWGVVRFEANHSPGINHFMDNHAYKIYLVEKELVKYIDAHPDDAVLLEALIEEYGQAQRERGQWDEIERYMN